MDPIHHQNSTSQNSANQYSNGDHPVREQPSQTNQFVEYNRIRFNANICIKGRRLQRVDNSEQSNASQRSARQLVQDKLGKRYSEVSVMLSHLKYFGI